MYDASQKVLELIWNSFDFSNRYKLNKKMQDIKLAYDDYHVLVL